MRSARTDVDATGPAAIGMAETTGVAMTTARSIGKEGDPATGPKSKINPAWSLTLFT